MTRGRGMGTLLRCSVLSTKNSQLPLSSDTCLWPKESPRVALGGLPLSPAPRRGALSVINFKYKTKRAGLLALVWDAFCDTAWASERPGGIRQKGLPLMALVYLASIPLPYFSCVLHTPSLESTSPKQEFVSQLLLPWNPT